ncbi:MAG: SDR family oxidoreductase [Sphingomonadales bacterium]|nr:SDR family oxidoreductase [Sphingomonadales bacterium]
MGLLEGKVAIVTGAGQGVGRGIALALAREGAAVAVIGRTLEKCQRTVAEIEAAGGRGIALSARVSHRDEVDASVAAVIAALGGVDILVNNAHSSRPMVPFEENTDKDMAIAMQGFHGAFFYMQACFEQLKARKGRVINLGSSAGIRGDAGFTSYAAGKEAVRAISRVAAREWGIHGVTVNVVCPFSDSPGIEYMIENQPGFIDELTSETVLKRLGSSRDDVGRTVAFLASEGGGYITGQTINVDGGMVIVP